MVFILPFLFMFSALLKIKSSSSLPDSTFCCGILLTITRNVITTLFCVQMFQNNYQKAWMEGKSHLLSSWSGLYEMLSINYCFNLQGSQSQMPTSSTMKRADRAWETRSPPSSIFPFPLLTEKWFQEKKKKSLRIMFATLCENNNRAMNYTSQCQVWHQDKQGWPASHIPFQWDFQL